MLELLIGLVIATVAVIGWFYGNLFVCVFLTLGFVLLAAFSAMLAPAGGAVIVLLVAVIMIGVIWAPRFYRLYPPLPRVPSPRVPLPPRQPSPPLLPRMSGWFRENLVPTAYLAVMTIGLVVMAIYAHH
jgi:hypothetical protein